MGTKTADGNEIRDWQAGKPFPPEVQRMNLTDALDAIEGATRDLKMPSYYRDMLLRGHPAYLSAHHRDSNLMSELARGKRDRPWLRVQRRHFYLAFQGLNGGL